MRPFLSLACLFLLTSGCVLDRSGTRDDGADASVERDAGTGMDGGRTDAGRHDAAVPDAGFDAGGCADGTVDLDRDPTNGCECVVVDEGCDCTPEGSTRDCGSDVGACRFGVQTCGTGGVWGECVGATDPETETCNGVDDDCDGVVDTFSRACGSSVGACTMGTETCVDGSFSACTGMEARPEVCDGVVDESCDGVVDEGCECSGAQTRRCGTPGCMGIETCSDGRYGMCVITTAADETCNGRDDDCNGVVDDGMANCADGTGCDLVRIGGGTYLFCYHPSGGRPDERRSWRDARDFCHMRGYELVTIDDAAEDAALAAEAATRDGGDWWIGINDFDDDGRYAWVGPGSMYIHFRGPPMRGDCGVLDASAMDWEAKGCAGGKVFICEAPPP